jgi:hypothetical protein
MNILRRIGIFSFLVVFLFSTTGISILHHICNSSHHDDVTVYPEFFKGPGASCCEEDDAGAESNDQSEGMGSSDSLNIKAMPCCVNVNSFFKLQLPTVRAEKIAVNANVIIQPLFSLSLTEPVASESSGVPIRHFQFYSPPLFGRRLIHFLHQPKIPQPSVLS